MTTPTAPIPMAERLGLDYQWTARQREVLTLIERGRNNLEIADALGIPATV